MARPLVVLLALAPVLAGCTAPADPQDLGTDLIVHHARVWTNDGAGTIAEAIAVDEGRIVRLGPDRDVLGLRVATTKVVDAGGGSVLPGLRDQHAHVLEVAAGTGLIAQLGGAGQDGDPYAPALGQQSVADTEAGRAQVMAYHQATKLARKTPMDDWQSAPTTDCRAPSAVTPELKDRLRAGLRAAAAQGLTTFVEPGLQDLGVWTALQEMEQEGPLPVRVLVRVAWGCIDEAAAMGLRTGVGSEWVRVLGVKLYGDGWLGPRTCALREPFSDRPLNEGVLFIEPGRAEADVRKARELGFHVGTHAIGDRAMEVMLDAYEANGVRPEDRWSLEHVQVLAPDLIARFADLGVVMSMQTSFATSDMGFAEDALGEERARWAYAWKSALDAGARLAGGTDFPIDVLHPLWGLQRVVTRSELTGEPAGGWHPEERLDLDTALRLVTSGAAYASLEDDRGRLVPGAWADLTVLRENLHAIPEQDIAGATVVLTVANGVVGFEGARSFPPELGAAGQPRWPEAPLPA